MICCFNDKLLDSNLVPSALLGSPELAPEGVYDTMRVDMVSAIEPDAHFMRLSGAASALDLPFSKELSVWKQQIIDVLNANQKKLEEGKSSGTTPVSFKIRSTVTRSVESSAKSDFLIAAWPVAYTDEIHLPVSMFFLKDGHRTRGKKLFNYKRLGLRSIRLTSASERNLTNEPGPMGRSDALFLNDEGNVCESRYANVFFVKGRTIFTPELDSPCLAGITRDIVIQLAGDHGIEVMECPVSTEAANSADAVFLTSSVRGIRMVEALENRQLPRVNTVFAKLQDSYDNLNKVSLV
jgi:branched-subunit amino acid aminotransferase/4-amino-4-deoxychorismate lyase